MEEILEKGNGIGSWAELNPGNARVLRQQIQELHQDHSLPAASIARILHVEEVWVIEVVRELGKMQSRLLPGLEREET